MYSATHHEPAPEATATRRRAARPIRWASLAPASSLDVPGAVAARELPVVGIADLSPDGARANLARVGSAGRAFAGRLRWRRRDPDRNTHVGEDWLALVRHPDIDIIVESTGSPVATVDHCLEGVRARQACGQRHRRGRCVSAAPLLARGAAEPACLLDGLRRPAGADHPTWWTGRAPAASGGVTGRGTAKWLPHYCDSTPETVWGRYDVTPEQTTAAA